MITEPSEDMACEFCGKRLGDAVFFEWLFASEEQSKHKMNAKCSHCGKVNVVISPVEYDKLSVGGSDV